MSFRRYVATGRCEPLAILAVLGVALVGGAITGAVLGVVGRWLWLIVLFPLLIGGVAGGLAAWTIARHRVRAPLLVLLLGAIGGAGGYVSSHAVSYLLFRSEITAAVKWRTPSASDSDVASRIDELLMQRAGHSGFGGYLTLAAEQGVSIKRLSTQEKGEALSGIAVWILWLVELLLAAGMAGAIAHDRARKPFCEDCQTWFGVPQLAAAGGTGASLARRELHSALEIGDFDRAAAVLVAPPTTSTFVVKSSECPRCSADCYCTLERVTQTSKGNRSRALESWLVTKGEMSQLADAIVQAKTRPAAAATQA
jgi:hypothetical protein